MLLKPDTYMNESGRAVGEATRFLKIGIEDVVAFHDELDISPGKIKVKSGGGNAGHNGLRSITQHVGNEFVRVRIGIGHPGAKELVHSYVLHDFAKADEAWLGPMLDAIAGSAERLASGDHARFLTEVSRAIGGETTEPQRSREKTSEPPPPKTPTSGRHPGGERMSKRQSALAENLKKWIAGRDKKE